MRNSILLVEDEPDQVELLRFNLEAAGFAVEAAQDAAEGLKLARALRPDLILLDVMLPELDGLEVCEILRRDSRTAAIPIFLVTAVSSHLSRCAGLAAGANDYFIKPFSMKALIARMREILTGQEAEAEAGQGKRANI